MCRITEGIHSFIDESQGLFDYSPKIDQARCRPQKSPCTVAGMIYTGFRTRAVDGCGKYVLSDHDGFTQHRAGSVRFGKIAFATGRGKAIKACDSKLC